MAKIQTQTISFTISKLVKGKADTSDETLDVVDQDVKDTVVELLEQSLGSEFVVEEQ